jgi:hypothetical protein
MLKYLPDGKSCNGGPLGYCPNLNMGEDVNGTILGDKGNQLPHTKLFKPTTWLLAECNTGKMV